MVEAYGKMEAVVDVAIKYPAKAELPRADEPSTESLAYGVVVPTPRFPPERIERTLLELGPKNSAILPAPFWTKVKKVDAVLVEFVASARKNCSLLILSKVSATKAAGTAPSFFLGLISPSQEGVLADPPISTPR